MLWILTTLRAACATTGWSARPASGASTPATGASLSGTRVDVGTAHECLHDATTGQRPSASGEQNSREPNPPHCQNDRRTGESEGPVVD